MLGAANVWGHRRAAAKAISATIQAARIRRADVGGNDDWLVFAAPWNAKRYLGRRFVRVDDGGSRSVGFA
jgi:hypothetical protein